MTGVIAATGYAQLRADATPLGVGSTLGTLTEPITAQGYGGSGVSYSYAWEVVSSPNNCVAVTPFSQTTRFDAGGPGTSLFRCAVSDGYRTVYTNIVTVLFQVP